MALAYQPYNLTLPSYSPVFTYLPYRDGDPTQGWNSSYSESNNDDPCDGDFNYCLGSGIAFRMTTSYFASFNLDFTGTAIYLCFGLGYVVGSLNIDGAITGTVAALGDPVCAMYGAYVIAVVVIDDLALAEHRATYNTDAVDGVEFYGAAVTISAGQPGPKKVEVIDDSDSQWNYEGNWGWNGDDEMWNGNYHTTATYASNSSASYTFTGASAVILRGLSGCNSGPYTVELNDQTASFNASDLHWRHAQSVLYFAGGLNPNQAYTITLFNYDASAQNATPFEASGGCSGLWAAVDTLTLIMEDTASLDALTALFSFAPAWSTVSPSTIAAAVLGGLLFVLLALSALFFALIQRRKRKRGTPTIRRVRPSPLIPTPWTSDGQPGASGDPATTGSAQRRTKQGRAQERSAEEQGPLPAGAPSPPVVANQQEPIPAPQPPAPVEPRIAAGPHTLGEFVTTLSHLLNGHLRREYLQQDASEGLPEYDTDA